MAELYQVYGGLDNSYASANTGDYFNEEEQPTMQYKQKAKEAYQAPLPPPVQIPQQPQQPQQVQHVVQQQPHKQIKETFQNSDSLQDYYQQPSKNISYKQNPTYSFWDRMSIKRSEVMKLAVFSLVIVLAISLERIGTHYLSKYLSDNILTDIQELMLRLSYPIMIFIFLWIVKSL